MSPTSGVVHATEDGISTACGYPIRGLWRHPDAPPPDCQGCVKRFEVARREAYRAGMHVYALRSAVGDREIVKFGESAAFPERLAQIRRAMPAPVEVIGVWEGNDRAVHDLLLHRVGEVVELFNLPSNGGGRMEWYYRDFDTDTVLAVLQADSLDARWALAQAAAWARLARWAGKAQLVPRLEV